MLMFVEKKRLEFGESDVSPGKTEFKSNKANLLNLYPWQKVI